MVEANTNEKPNQNGVIDYQRALQYNDDDNHYYNADDYNDFTGYTITTISPENQNAFQYATTILLVTLLVLFLPTVQCLRRRRKRRKQKVLDTITVETDTERETFVVSSSELQLSNPNADQETPSAIPVSEQQSTPKAASDEPRVLSDSSVASDDSDLIKGPYTNMTSTETGFPREDAATSGSTQADNMDKVEISVISPPPLKPPKPSRRPRRFRSFLRQNWKKAACKSHAQPDSYSKEEPLLERQTSNRRQHQAQLGNANEHSSSEPMPTIATPAPFLVSKEQDKEENTDGNEQMQSSNNPAFVGTNTIASGTDDGAKPFVRANPLATPLLAAESSRTNFRCFDCGSTDLNDNVADLLDGVDDTDDDIFDVDSHFQQEGGQDNESVPLFKTSMLQACRSGRNRSFLLGRNKVFVPEFQDADPDEMLEQEAKDRTTGAETWEDEYKDADEEEEQAQPKHDVLTDDQEDQGPPNYDDCYWDELPSSAKTAAEALGYSRKIWDNDQEPEEVSDMDWDDLTLQQRAAALELGWTQQKWDGVDQNGEPASTEESALANIQTEVEKGRQMTKTVLSCDRQSKRLLRLALPATIATSMSPLLDGIMTAVFVTHMGPSKYLAWVMVDFFLDITKSTVNGIAEAEGLLTAQAIGMKKYTLAGQYVQLTMVLDVIISIPAYALWVIFIGDIMVSLGFGEEVARYASIFVPFSAATRMVEGSLGEGLDRLMWSEQRGGTMTIIEVAFYILYLGAFLVMIFGFDNTSLITLGLIDLIFAITHSICLYGLCKWKGWLQKYEKGLFGHWALNNRALTFGVLKMSAPLTLGHFLLNCEWQILTVFAAHMGAAETAAWTIAASLWSLLETFPSGVNSGGEILICQYLGSGRPDLAKAVAYKTLLYGLSTGLLFTACFACFRESIVYYFTDEDTLFALLYDMVSLLCIGNVVMSLGNSAYSILESQGRTKLPVAIYFLAIVGITLPLSAWFTFGQNYGLESILMACVFGYSISSFLMLLVVFTSNWPKMSRKAILKAAKYEKKLETMLETGGIKCENPVTYKDTSKGVMV